MRIDDDEPLTLEPLDSLLVEPGSVRQLFNDGGAADGPKALPPELDG